MRFFIVENQKLIVMSMTKKLRRDYVFEPILRKKESRMSVEGWCQICKFVLSRYLAELSAEFFRTIDYQQCEVTCQVLMTVQKCEIYLLFWFRLKIGRYLLLKITKDTCISLKAIFLKWTFFTLLKPFNEGYINLVIRHPLCWLNSYFNTCPKKY